MMFETIMVDPALEQIWRYNELRRSLALPPISPTVGAIILWIEETSGAVSLEALLKEDAGLPGPREDYVTINVSRPEWAIVDLYDDHAEVCHLLEGSFEYADPNFFEQFGSALNWPQLGSAATSSGQFG